MAGFPEFPANGHAFSAAETGEALASFIRRDSAGAPVPGMLVAPTLTAVASSWQVRVSPFGYVRKVGNGVAFSGQATDGLVTIAPATSIPAGQSRIDRIVWDTAAAALAVVTGTPAGSPVAPSDGGMVRVGRVLVVAGDSAVVQAKITPDFAVTGLAGGGRVAQGTVAKRTVGAGSSIEVPVVFPVGMFSTPPVVQVTVMDVVRDVNAGISGDVTTDGFTISLGSNSVVARTFGASWRAEQL